MKTQIESYKKQIQELHENSITQEMKMKKYDYENKRYEDKLITIQQEKEHLLNEINSLKQQNGHSSDLEIDGVSFDRQLLTSNNLAESMNRKPMNDQMSEFEILNLPLEIKYVFRKKSWLNA
jgi:hypothetical protein